MKTRTPIPAGRVAELCHELMLLGAEATFLLKPEGIEASDANEARRREIVAELKALGIRDENIPLLFD